MEVFIGSAFETMSGIVKDARNSFKTWSFPCQSGGTTPWKIDLASVERLVQVTALYITP
jgi:hypothetical protein